MIKENIINCLECNVPVDCDSVFSSLCHWRPDNWNGTLTVVCNNCGKVLKIDRKAKKIQPKVEVGYVLAGQEAAKKRVEIKRAARKKEKEQQERIDKLEALRILVMEDPHKSNDDLLDFANSIGELKKES